MLRIISFLIINSLSFNVLAASVSTLYVDDAASHSERAFEVKNTSDVVEYITLSVERRLNKQNGKFTTQPMTDLAQQEVLVSPAYFVLAPNSRQTVRITPLLEKGEQERLYYIAVNPKLPPTTSEQPQAALRMISAYKVLYLVRPKNPIINYSLNVIDTRLQLNNQGNTSVLLHRIYACPAKDSARKLCSQLQGERVMAGEVFTFDPLTTAAKGYWIEMQLAGQLKQEWVAIP
jgi:P pilus assembly chaperone PapD